MLIHIGIDTVQLAGRGFEARVQPGARVRTGDEIIRFDLDVAARGAKSLMTPIVVTTEGSVLKNRRSPGPVSAGELLFEIDATPPRGRAAASGTSSAGGSAAASQERAVVITLPQGLHARPAALLARRAKAIASPIVLAAHGRETDARSVVGIMALGVRCGDELLIRAEGGEAQQAFAAMLEGLEEAQRLDAAHALPRGCDYDCAGGSTRPSGGRNDRPVGRRNDRRRRCARLCCGPRHADRAPRA